MEFLSAEEARKIKYHLTLNKVRGVLKDIEKHIKLKSEDNKNILYYSTIAFETDFIKKFLRDKGYGVFTNFDNINNRVSFEIRW